MHCLHYSKQCRYFLFGYLSKSEMLGLFGIDMPSQLAVLPSYAVLSKSTKLPHLGDSDIDEDLVHSINSKYFEISELNNFKMSEDTMSLYEYQKLIGSS